MGTPRLLDDDSQDKLTSALASCSTVADACRYAGITSERFYEWQRRGKEYDEHLDTGGEIIEGEDVYRLMYLAVREARARARVRAAGTIRDLQRKDMPPHVRFRAASWYLERSDPENWGRRIIRVEADTGQRGDMPSGVTDVEMELAESLQAYLADLKAQATARPAAIDVASRELGPAGRDVPGGALGGETVIERVRRPGHRPSRFRPPPPVE